MNRYITLFSVIFALALPVFSAEAASQSVRVKSSSHTTVDEDGKTSVRSETREESTDENGTSTTRNFHHMLTCVGTQGTEREECMEEVRWNDDGNAGSAARRIDAKDTDDTAGISRFASSDTWANLPATVQAFIRDHLQSRVSRSVLSETDEESDKTRMNMKERSHMRREMRRVSWELCNASFAAGGRNCLRGSVSTGEDD